MSYLYSGFKASLVLVCFTMVSAQAAIVINGTRVVYPSNAKEVTVQLSNDGEKPSLVQAWVDEGDPNTTPDDSKAPFILTPPISRVEPKAGQALRLSSIATNLPMDRETVFWLNVLDIPPAPATKTDDPDNFLQLAIRSRIKIFYRPNALKGEANQAPESLKWSIKGDSLVCQNPTPYHVNFTRIGVVVAGKAQELTPNGVMLEPNATKEFKLNPVNGKPAVEFTTINDFGGRVDRQVTQFN
jgi:chaperone protein EcpD